GAAARRAAGAARLVRPGDAVTRRPEKPTAARAGMVPRPGGRGSDVRCVLSWEPRAAQAPRAALMAAESSRSETTPTHVLTGWAPPLKMKTRGMLVTRNRSAISWASSTFNLPTLTRPAN